MESIASFIINVTPGLSITELQDIADKLNIDAYVINADSVKNDDIQMLYNALNDGYSLILFIHMNNIKNPSSINPDGHFIALIKHGDNLEIFDPAGDDVDVYMRKNPWIRKLSNKYNKIESFRAATQPTGSNSCGPWSLIRVATKDMSMKNFNNHVIKARQMLTKAHSQQAFGPVGRHAPFMSQLKSERYGGMLCEHSNMNLPCAKHVAHVINRSVEDDNVAETPMLHIIDELKDHLPGLEFHDDFVDAVGGVPAKDFNNYAKNLKKVRQPKTLVEHRVKSMGGGVMGGGVMGGAAMGGAVMGGAAMGGKKPSKAGAQKPSKAGKPKAGAMLGGLKAGAMLGGLKGGGPLGGLAGNKKQPTDKRYTKTNLVDIMSK